MKIVTESDLEEITGFIDYFELNIQNLIQAQHEEEEEGINLCTGVCERAVDDCKERYSLEK